MRRARGVRAIVHGLLIAMAAGCGGSSASPSPAPIAVAGEWSGTWQFVTSGVTVSDNVHATFTQTDTVTGTWTADSGATGQFQFGAGSSVSGTLTISQPRVSGGTCTATAPLTGTVSASAMTLSVPTIAPTPQCNWATSNQFSLHR